MLVGAVLLFIDLFLAWQDFGGGIADDLGIDATFSGWRGIGAILGIVTIVLVAWIAVRLAGIDLPLPISTAMTSALLAALVLLFAVIKILTILGDEPTIWAWIGLILAAVVAVGGWLTVQEAGGIDKLKAEMPAMVASTAAPAAPPPPSSPPAPESAPEPAAPPPSEERSDDPDRTA